MLWGVEFIKEKNRKMEKIEVKAKSESENEWIFDVQIDVMDYEVTVEKGDYERLTNGGVTPEELVEKSFKFLLAREPKESILKQFNLMEIARYFPEYEQEISNFIV